jgi:hypothetical protein
MDSAALIRVAAANHRSWFRRLARARGGGRIERFGGVDLILDGRFATIAFPRSRRVDAAVARIRELGATGASCWTMGPIATSAPASWRGASGGAGSRTGWRST